MTDNQPAADRLLSLDVFRGLIMFLLVADTSGLSLVLRELPEEGTFWHALVTQFHHHPWHGLRFWDLVQPFFMFIVGVAMAFSVEKRAARGQGWSESFFHILYRCVLLLLLGVALHCIYARELTWELWNVLSQLSVTILIAFLIMQWSIPAQIVVSVVFLAITELLYRSWPIEGYNEPFVSGKNFGTWMDIVLMGKINSDGWVAINCIPTAAHTIWGVVAGQVLMNPQTPIRRLGILVLWGAILLAIGYGLDGFGITPFIKRLCTSSFVIASGGWCLVVLALLYGMVDVLGFKRWGFVFVVIGMNPIFIYLFSESIGRQWLNGTVAIFTDGALKPLGTSETTQAVVAASVVVLLEWLLCYWLYKRKILIKI